MTYKLREHLLRTRKYDWLGPLGSNQRAVVASAGVRNPIYDVFFLVNDEHEFHDLTSFLKDDVFGRRTNDE